jgi:hypothetical protein
MTDGTKGGAQRARSLRSRCVGEVDPETSTHIYHSSDDPYHFHLHVAFIRRTKGRGLENFQKTMIFGQ